MDTESTNIIDNYLQALDDTPIEVREFLWSNTYKNLVDKMAELFALSAEQRETVSSMFIDGVIGQVTPEVAQKRLTDAGISPENQAKIMELGYQFIASEAMRLSADELELEKESEIDAAEQAIPEAPSAPSPTEALASIQARLQTSATVAPIVRDISMQKPPAPQPPADLPTKPAADLYREAVE